MVWPIVHPSGWGRALLPPVVALVVLSGCTGGPSTTTVVPSGSGPPPTTGAATGRPGPDNTGVPAGVELDASDGLRIVEDGTVIDGLDVDGCVVVAADDVVIKNTRIRCADPESEPAVRVLPGHRGLLVQDTEIDGLGQAAMGVGYSGYHLLRVDVHGVNDGARLSSSTTVEASWIHDLARKDDLHPDAVQSTSGVGVVVRGNTLDSTSGDDLGNSAVMLGTETGDHLLSDAVFEGNWLNGGNYTVNIRSDANLEDVVFRNNVYGPDHRYGPVRSPDDVAFDSDTSEATGEPVEVDESR